MCLHITTYMQEICQSIMELKREKIIKDYLNKELNVSVISTHPPECIHKYQIPSH